MQAITTIGLDIAKSVFQVHCVDANGEVVLRRQLKRRYERGISSSLCNCRAIPRTLPELKQLSRAW